MKSALTAALAAISLALAPTAPAEPPFAVVLGIAQDGGVPQTGDRGSAAWDDLSKRQLAACLAVVDPATGERWLIDATPDLKEQLHQLDRIAPASRHGVLDGIFLTHAHIGHYLGLAQLGHEALGARGIPVYAMPRMSQFLSRNGPWDQLVRYRNIELRELTANREVRLNDRLSITPIPVPHRQEYSEVVGFRIQGPARAVLYIPDIDAWEDWDRMGVPIEEMIAGVDAAFLDGTFFANGEIPGRDMSGFPHPMISHSLERFARLPASERAKIHFIHLNHTNPALDPESPQSERVKASGMAVAETLQRVEL